MVGLDTACAQSRAVSFHEGLSPLANLHFAVASDLSHQGVEPEIFAGYQLALQQFTETGAELTSCDFSQFDCAASRRAGLLVGEVDMYVQQQTQFHAHPEYYSAELTKMMNWGANKGALDVVKADWRLDETCVKMAQLLSGVDFLLLPTAPQTAFDFLSPVPVGQADLTNIANMSGHPAISVPIGLSKAGLPMGLQIIGHHGSDLQLIELAQNFVARANINVAVNPKSLVAAI